MADVDVCGEIITRGLVEADTRHHAAKCLDAVAAGKARNRSRRARDDLAAPPPPRSFRGPVARGDLDDDVVGRATSAAAAAAVRAAPAAVDPARAPAPRFATRLGETGRVAAAAEGLLGARGRRAPAPMIPPGETLPESVRAKIDPFGVILRHGDPASAAAAYAAEYHRARTRDETEHVASAPRIRERAELADVLAGTRSDRVFDARRRINCASRARDARLESDVASPTALATAARLAAAALEAGGEDAYAPTRRRRPRRCSNFLAPSSRTRAPRDVSSPNSTVSRATARRVPSRVAAARSRRVHSFRLCFTRDRRRRRRFSIAIRRAPSSSLSGG